MAWAARSSARPKPRPWRDKFTDRSLHIDRQYAIAESNLNCVLRATVWFAGSNPTPAVAYLMAALAVDVKTRAQKELT